MNPKKKIPHTQNKTLHSTHKSQNKNPKQKKRNIRILPSKEAWYHKTSCIPPVNPNKREISQQLQREKTVMEWNPLFFPPFSPNQALEERERCSSKSLDWGKSDIMKWPKQKNENPRLCFSLKNFQTFKRVPFSRFSTNRRSEKRVRQTWKVRQGKLYVKIGEKWQKCPWNGTSVLFKVSVNGRIWCTSSAFNWMGASGQILWDTELIVVIDGCG